MYIAMALTKLLGEKDGAQKLVGIPVKALYKAGDTMEVTDHLWLSEAKLKLECVETVSTGNDAFDEGMTVGDLLRLPSDGVLVTESDSLLGTGSITRGKYTLTFAPSVKEALDACKKADKKSAAKRKSAKTAKPAHAKEEANADAELNTDVNQPDADAAAAGEHKAAMADDADGKTTEPVNGTGNFELDMNPPVDQNESESEMTEKEADTASDVTDTADAEAGNTGTGADALTEQEAPAKDDTAAAAPARSRSRHVKKFPDEIVSPAYRTFKDMIDSLGVSVANAPYILTAFQISDGTPDNFRKSLSYVYNGLEDDVDMFAGALMEDLAALKRIADEVEPYEATLRD